MKTTKRKPVKLPVATGDVIQVVKDAPLFSSNGDVIFEANVSQKLTERSMRQKEDRIPKLAADAVKQARTNTLKAGRSVIEVKNCQLVETLPDGTFNVIRALTPPTKVTPGQQLVRKIK